MESSYNPLIGAKKQFEQIEAERRRANDQRIIDMVNKSMMNRRKSRVPSVWFDAIAMLIALAVIVVAVCFLSKPVMAAETQIPDNKAILAIIGEAEDQGYTGMLAVAGAMRNRGTLKGVYGVNAPRVKQKKYSPSIYAQAKKAWLESNHNDITRGATHWESVDFKVPYWAKSMKVSFKHKKHVFYREA